MPPSIHPLISCPKITCYTSLSYGPTFTTEIMQKSYAQKGKRRAVSHRATPSIPIGRDTHYRTKIVNLTDSTIQRSARNVEAFLKRAAIAYLQNLALFLEPRWYHMQTQFFKTLRHYGHCTSTCLSPPIACTTLASDGIPRMP